MRTGEIKRTTVETDIELKINLDGKGISDIDTGVGFFDHMLTLFAKHGGFDLSVKCKGDTGVDDHHSIEDIGICLGKAFCEAIGDKKGIYRYGNITLPMDEALVLAAVDISGRAYMSYRLEIPSEKVGDFDTELVEEFLQAFAFNAGLTLHAVQLAGTNSHHIIEAAFKGLARALRQAVKVDADFKDQIPTTKGLL